MPSRLQISAIDSSPRNPSITIAIFSSELNCALDLRLMSLIVASDFFGLPGPVEAYTSIKKFTENKHRLDLF